jgi:galactokinase
MGGGDQSGIVAVGAPLAYDSEYVARHELCLAAWRVMTMGTQEELREAVAIELERLLLSIDNWLAGSALPSPNGPHGSIDILLRVYPDRVQESRKRLALEEQERAKRAVEDLDNIVKNLD